MWNETDSVLVIQPANGRHSAVWLVGYEVDGQFRPFAGVTTEAGLKELVDRERARRAEIVVEDRR